MRVWEVRQSQGGSADLIVRRGALAKLAEHLSGFSISHTWAGKRATFYWSSRSSEVSFGQKRWSQRIHISLVQRSSVYWFEMGLLHKRYVLSVLSQHARCKHSDVEVAARHDETRYTLLSACAWQEQGHQCSLVPFGWRYVLTLGWQWLISVGTETLISKHRHAST